MSAQSRFLGQFLTINQLGKILCKYATTLGIHSTEYIVILKMSSIYNLILETVWIWLCIRITILLIWVN